MRRAFVFVLLATSAAAVGCSLFVDLDALQASDGGSASDAAPTDAPTGSTSPDGAPTCAADTAKDPHNCGACGHDCQGGDCAEGTCSPFTFVGYQGRVGAIACDDAAVYWLLLDTAAPAVWRKDLGAAGPGMSLFAVDDSAFDIAVDRTRVYVTQTPGTLGIVTGDKQAAGIASTFYGSDASDFNPSLAIDGEHILVGEFPHGTDNGWLAVFAPDGGLSGLYDTGGNYTRGVGTSGGTVFLAAASGTPNEIRTLPVTGGAFTTVSDPFGAYSYTNIAVDDAGVAWVTAGHDIGYFDRTVGGKASDRFDGGYVSSVALGGSAIYAAVDAPDAGAEAGTIFAVPRSGGAATAIARSQDHPRSIHACPTANVWLAGDDRIVMQAR